jgi:hypothetical protein
VPGGISGPSCSLGIYIRALQIGGVSDETVKYGREFWGTLTQECLLWQGSEAIVQVNYRPAFSPERSHRIKKAAIVREKTKIWSWEPHRIPAPRQTGRLTIGRKLTSRKVYLKHFRFTEHFTLLKQHWNYFLNPGYNNTIKHLWQLINNWMYVSFILWLTCSHDSQITAHDVTWTNTTGCCRES